MTQKPQTPKHTEHVALGMGAAVGAYFMFSLMVAFAKLLSDTHSVIEIAFYRNVIGCLPFLFIVFALGKREILVLRTQPVWVAIRAVLGTVSLVTTFWAFSLMPLADTTALLFTASLFIPVLGVLILRESVGPWRWSAVAIGFVGVLVMTQPTGDIYILGISVAILAAFMHAILQIILRYLGRYESPATISFYFFVIGAGLTATAMPFVARLPTISEIPFLLGVGFSGAAAQWLLSVAYRNAPAAIVTVFNYTSIVWATFFGWAIWNDWPKATVVTGAIIVIASNILIAWRESQTRKPAMALTTGPDS